MSAEQPSKRRQRNAPLPVSWEENAANPVGASCPLLLCRDLLSLATNSIDIFDEVLGNLESLSKIQAHFRDFARRVLNSNGLCTWLLVLLYCGPHESTVELLEELITAFSAGRLLPKGFSIRSSRGKAFLPPDEHSRAKKACQEAIRLVLFLSGQLIKEPLEPRDPLWMLEVKLLQDEDIKQAALACNSLLYEIECNSERIILYQELNAFVAAFRMRVLSFEKVYVDFKEKKNQLEENHAVLQKCRRKFKNLLKEIARVEDESSLDVPLDHYLKEHDDLRIAHTSRQKAQKKKDLSHAEFNSVKGDFDVLFSCIRNIGILVARGVAMYTGLYIDKTSLLSIEPDHMVPSTSKAASKIHPFLFGGDVTSADNTSQRERVVAHLINDIPWKTLASLVHIEKVVCGTLSLRLVAAVAAKLSDKLQSRLGPWLRRSLHDLIQCLRWYSVKEDIPENYAKETSESNPNMVRGLMTLLEEKTSPLPKWKNFKRSPNLDTRIATALSYWCIRGNTAMAERVLKWEEVVNGVLQKGKYIWKLLVERAEEKSSIIEDASEYYERTDPTRVMQEMNKITLSRAMNELDSDVDSDSDSDTDSNSDDEDDRCSTDDENGTCSSEEDEEILAFLDPEEEDHIMSVVVEARHSSVIDDLLLDEYALAVLHCSATEIVLDDIPEINILKDAKLLSTGSYDCSRFMHIELYSHAVKLLEYALEGPSGGLDRRFIHPLHIVPMIVQHSTSHGSASSGLCEYNGDIVARMLLQCKQIREGVCDIIAQRVSIELIISALGGPYPRFIYLSHVKNHCHTVEEMNAAQYALKASKDGIPEIEFFRQLKANGLSSTLLELVTCIYDSKRSDFMPTGATGRCHLALVLRLLSVLADFDGEFVIKCLKKACKHHEEQGEKLWSNASELPSDLLWLAPIIIALEYGALQLVSIHKKTMGWKETVVDEELYGNSVYRCNLDIVRGFSCLLSVLCTVDPSLCFQVGESSAIVVSALLEALKFKDRVVSQHVFRTATAVVHHAKEYPATSSRNNKAISKLVPFDAPATYFRTMFIQEGDALEVACEMLSGVRHDVWLSEDGGLEGNGTGHKSDNRASSKVHVAESITEENDDDSKDGGDARSPDCVNTSNNNCVEEKLDEPSVGSNDTRSNDRGHVAMEPPPAWKQSHLTSKSVEAKSFALFTLECIIELVESRLELQDRICEKSPNMFQCLYRLLTPKKIEEFSASISSQTQSVGGLSRQSSFDDGARTLTAHNAHIGLIGATAETVRIVSRRHPKIRALIRESGCIEGLMDALDMSYAIDDRALGLYVVAALEQLIVRNIESWNFVKRAAGVRGLLQLCHMGNSAVRILTTTEIISQITPKHEPIIYSISEDVLSNNGLSTIIRMLKSRHENVQTSALSLLQALCVNKLACRHAVLMPDFMCELGSLLFSSSLSVVRVACDVMSVLGAEDQYTLTKLVRGMESHALRIGEKVSHKGKRYCSITGRLMDISNGIMSTTSFDEVAFETKASKSLSVAKPQQYSTEMLPPLFDSEPRLKQEIATLSNKAAAVLAAMTDTEESNWPDGGAPLRNTLTRSGILPSIAGKRPSQTTIMDYK